MTDEASSITMPDQNAAMLNASPKVVYSTFVLSVASRIFDSMGTQDEDGTERKCMTLASFVLDENVQKKIIAKYLVDREEVGAFSACITMVGRCIRSLSQSLEWDEKSYGGWG